MNLKTELKPRLNNGQDRRQAFAAVPWLLLTLSA